MIRSNPPQLSVGICDMLGAGHPSPLPPPPADSAHMLSCSGMQVWEGKLNGKRCPLQNACPRLTGEMQPTSQGGWGVLLYPFFPGTGKAWATSSSLQDPLSQEN